MATSSRSEAVQPAADSLATRIHAEGIDFVLINGEFAVDTGKLTGALPGKVLTTGAARTRPSTN